MNDEFLPISSNCPLLPITFMPTGDCDYDDVDVINYGNKNSSLESIAMFQIPKSKTLNNGFSFFCLKFH